MQWTEINGAVMRHDAKGEGRVLVLVHEMGGTLNSYDAVFDELSKSYKVIRYDLRGAGLSEKVSGRLDIDMLADDIAGLLDHYGINTPVALVGAAVAAAICLRFSLRHPARAACMVGFSPVTACAPENRAGVLGHAGRIETEGLRVLEPNSMPLILPEALRQDRAAFEAARSRWLANDPQSFAAIYRMFAYLDISADYGRIAIPCLFVGATHDTLRTPAAVKAVADVIADCRYAELDTGHIAMVQTPELVIRTLTDFHTSVGFGPIRAIAS